MTHVQGWDRRDRTASPAGVFDGAVTSAMTPAPFGAKAVLSGLVFGMGRAPGAVVGGIGHRSGSMTVGGRPVGALGRIGQQKLLSTWTSRDDRDERRMRGGGADLRGRKARRRTCAHADGEKRQPRA
jgi:hypothetical protein